MPVGKSSLLRAGKTVAAPALALPENNMVKIAVEKVRALPKNYASDQRAENVALVKAYGVYEPLLLWADGETLRVLRGANTLAACKELGISEAPAIVLSMTAAKAKEFARTVNASPVSAAEPSISAPAQSALDKIDSIHEEKFKAVAKISQQLPYYLL